jgi:hypothetical protein
MSAERHLLKEALVHVPFLGITLVHAAWFMYTSVLIFHLVQFTWCLRTLRSQAWKACLVKKTLNIYPFLVCYAGARVCFFFAHARKKYIHTRTYTKKNIVNIV